MVLIHAEQCPMAMMTARSRNTGSDCDLRGDYKDHYCLFEKPHFLDNVRDECGLLVYLCVRMMLCEIRQIPTIF